jgi:hypothetical protein
MAVHSDVFPPPLFFFSTFLISDVAIAGEITTIAGDLDILTSLGGCRVVLL